MASVHAYSRPPFLDPNSQPAETFGDLAAAGIPDKLTICQYVVSVTYQTDHLGPPPTKRSRLAASEPSASGASTPGPSSANGMDTKHREWKPKDHKTIVATLPIPL